MIMDSDLNFEKHIMTKVNKGNSIMGLICLIFTFTLGFYLFKKLYVTFVRPHLENAQGLNARHQTRRWS